jgi:hypothetical protein
MDNLHAMRALPVTTIWSLLKVIVLFVLLDILVAVLLHLQFYVLKVITVSEEQRVVLNARQVLTHLRRDLRLVPHVQQGINVPKGLRVRFY